ncbi:cytochrome d ubiquinol oxidase subunit II [Robbsia sp. Bb-Pol-6]|uniref:Cytochrome d ubiquinol oxidase subunit II n=1 Tax=Robbsia betulipollinis TaxID=2981849 RepID=A0ABT3ZJV0_9BURK|nr:cytochrome d ubiquinol oxidase subunit II [Robbsia betulipollinis]MCY0386813.1 cytochrome d ubiquinol oxidase subunit II [Robbsia betulipollinis]
MATYLALKVVWWLLVGVVLIGVGVMVGMDMGVGTLLRYVGRTDIERRVALNIVGPHWEGNQVWFILGGGALFAAFPLIYGTAFSGFYIVMLLLLWSMIVRPLAFEYRSKLPGAGWRNGWDWMLLVSGFLPMLVFGAAVGNVLEGVPFHFSWNMTSTYSGSFLALFNPFAILCGLLSVALSCYMGAATLGNGAAGAIAERARVAGRFSGLLSFVLFAIGGVWLRHIDGYALQSGPAGGAVQTPLQQTVVRQAGAWNDNFAAHPALWLLPGLALAALLVGSVALGRKRGYLAWWLGLVVWAGVIGSVGATMFPFMMPSSAEPSHSLTVWNASSSELTLSWMLGFTVVFIPLIVWYTSWCFYVMRGKVSAEKVAADEHAY